jgi:hypothetical protein
VIGSSRRTFWRHENHIAWQRAAKDAQFQHAAFQGSKSFEIEISK